MQLYIQSIRVEQGCKCRYGRIYSLFSRDCQRGSGPNLFYKNTLHTFYKIITLEGWRSLYKGFAIVAGFTVPAHALYFVGYETSKKLLAPHTKMEEKGFAVHFTSGMVADLMGALVWVPQDVVKQRLQIQQNSLKKGAAAAKNGTHLRGPIHCMKTIIVNEGIMGLWKGFIPAIAVYCPFVGMYFGCYEQSKRIFKRVYGWKSAEDGTMGTQLIGGAAAGAIAAALTTPLDVVKTRIQVGHDYKNLLDAVRRISKEEGLLAFGKGIGARVFWISPGCAITIAAYEQFKKMVT